jgi:hypothetical protein
MTAAPPIGPELAVSSRIRDRLSKEFLPLGASIDTNPSPSGGRGRSDRASATGKRITE